MIKSKMKKPTKAFDYAQFCQLYGGKTKRKCDDYKDPNVRRVKLKTAFGMTAVLLAFFVISLLWSAA